MEYLQLIEYRYARIDEIELLKSFLWMHGPNEWNHLTEASVNEEFSLMEQGSARTIIATENTKLVGLAVVIDEESTPSYVSKYSDAGAILFIGDVVVSAQHAGKGIATTMLEKCIADAREKKTNNVLIERHEENLASAGMMKKAGFEIIDTFYDPNKRTVGSQNSVILKYTIKPSH